MMMMEVIIIFDIGYGGGQLYDGVQSPASRGRSGGRTELGTRGMVIWGIEFNAAEYEMPLVSILVRVG